MKHKTKGFIAMILALCLMMSLGIGALAEGQDHESDGPDPTGGNAVGGEMTDDRQEDGGPTTGDPGAPSVGPAPGVDPAPQPTLCMVTIGAIVNGTVTAKYVLSGEEQDIPATGVPAGSTVRLYTVPDTGYTLDSIKIGDSYPIGTGSPYYFVITGDTNVTANFKKVDYNVRIAGTTNGSVSADKTTAQYGDQVKLTIVPNEGYKLNELKVTDATNNEIGIIQNTFDMPASHVTVTATFEPKNADHDPIPELYDVTVSGTNFTVSGVEDKYEAGDWVVLTIVADNGYYLASVKLDGDLIYPGAYGNYTFRMPAHNVEIAVDSRPDWNWRDWHSIDVSCPYYCDVDVASWAYEDETVTFTVDPWYYYDYYSVGVWTDGGVKLSVTPLGNDKYSFTMPDDDVTIYVDYDYVGTYSITKDVEGDGSIYVRSSADRGDTVWIEASPNAGQSLTSLRVFYGEPWAYGDKGYYGYWDEADVHYSEYWDAYYFTMPADDVVVYARFTDGATVTVTSGDHGSAKVSSRYAEKGDWVYITAYPDDGYEVADVTVVDRLGKSVKVTELSSDYFLFTMPGTSVDVKVTFREVDYGYFYDVSRGDWYYEAVRFVHEKGIMAGTSTHYFSPNADLSRGMLATILYRLEGSPNVSGYSSFNDVSSTSYYAKAIAWAERNGIVNGVTTERFEPDTAVTREQMAAILCRYADYKGHDTSVSYDYLATFGDSGNSHVYARPALNWAVAHRIINGQGSSVLAPRATATRAEVAQVLMNYLEAYD